MDETPHVSTMSIPLTGRHERRVPVQIAVAAGETDDWLYVLCNDGSMWTKKSYDKNDRWHLIDEIPQDDLG